MSTVIIVVVVVIVAVAVVVAANRTEAQTLHSFVRSFVRWSVPADSE